LAWATFNRQTFCPLTVVENVQMALSADRQLWSFWRKAATPSGRRAGAAGTSGHAIPGRSALGVLAYGDVKRVELAMAIASNPQLLMDRPPPRYGCLSAMMMALTRQLVKTAAWPCCSPNTAWTWCLPADRLIGWPVGG
jgi:branched-chain amino acid transport system ATP-binding protein